MRLTFTACVRRVILQVVPLFLCTILLANDSQDGEKITLFEKATPLKTVFKKITSQTGIKFVYSNRLVDDEQKVDVSVKNASLEEVLQQVFYGRKFEVQRTSPKSVVLIVHEKNVSSVERSVAPGANNDVAIIDVTGVVSDDFGVRLPGATVLVKGTNKATMTDSEGRFKLEGIFANASVLFTYTGYEREEIKLTGERELRIRMKASANNLDETVVVAYGTSTQRTNTGAVTVIKGDQIQTLPNRSFDKSLQGIVPGLQITNGTGQPGGGVSNMVLRGIGTGGIDFSGPTVRNPLIIIDGIPVSQEHTQITIGSDNTAVNNPLAQINPGDIESISVLKDAAAIALYGSKASNGVILVTTKKGRTGKTVFQLRHQTDIASSASRTKGLNRQEYLELVYEGYKNSDPLTWTDAAIRKDLFLKFPNQVIGGDTSFYTEPDWNKELYRRNAATISNQISASGGNERSNYYINIEYTKQDGIVKNTGYDRKSFRINYESQPAKWLKIGTNTALSYNVQNYTNPGEAVSSYAAEYYLSPLNPVRDASGKYILNYTNGGTSGSPALQNPAAVLEYNINKIVSYRGMSNLRGSINFLKRFTFNSLVGIDFMFSEAKEKIDPRFKQFSGTEYGAIREKDTRRANLINTNTLAYDNAWGKHDINILAGLESQIISERELGGEVRGNANTFYTYEDINSPGYSMYSFSGIATRQTLLSQFGNANYSYNRRYFASASIRRDGSSKFGNDQQWGTYWSVGAGWIPSEESFFEPVKRIIGFFKIRGSLGAAGNSGAISATDKYEILTSGTYRNQTVLIGSSTPGNSNMQWEKTFNWNIGFEGRFLSDRIRITADLYRRKTTNLVYRINLPYSSGYTQVSDNIGDIENTGKEIAIQGDIIRNKSFQWMIAANWSSNNNILVKANVPFASLLSTLLANEVGRNFNSFYLKKWGGVNPENGKPRWVDSTGKLTENYALAKQEFVGKPQPDGFGMISNTFTYKRFSLYCQLYYQYGYYIYNQVHAGSILTDGLYPYANQTRDALDRWRKPGDIAANPKRVNNAPDRGYNTSTRYLEKGDHIRIQMVQLSFSFPGQLLSRLKLDKAKIYVQGNNLGLLTRYKNGDPDNVRASGNNGSAYPFSKTYSVGLNANF